MAGRTPIVPCTTSSIDAGYRPHVGAWKPVLASSSHTTLPSTGLQASGYNVCGTCAPLECGASTTCLVEVWCMCVGMACILSISQFRLSCDSAFAQGVLDVTGCQYIMRNMPVFLLLPRLLQLLLANVARCFRPAQATAPPPEGPYYGSVYCLGYSTLAVGGPLSDTRGI